MLATCEEAGRAVPREGVINTATAPLHDESVGEVVRLWHDTIEPCTAEGANTISKRM